MVRRREGQFGIVDTEPLALEIKQPARAAEIVQEMITELRSQGIDVMLARMESEIAQHAAERAGLLALLGPDHAFRSVEDAIVAYRARSKHQEKTT